VWWGQRGKRHHPRSRQVAWGLLLILSATAWGVIVWAWPGLHLGNNAGSRGLQPAVLIAVASIQAAVLVFGLAVGAVVLQVMAKYSWAVVRSVLLWWFLPVLVVVVGAGVVFPLWVAFSPTQRLSTAAFAAFGWAVLATGASVWESAQRMNPPSLSLRTRRRALTVLSRDDRDDGAADDVTEVLAQLVADAELPYDEGLRMVGTYTMVLADRARHASLGEVTVAVRGLGERATRVESVALASSIVRSLRVLGLDQVEHPRVFDEVHRALATIAGDARARDQRQVAGAALDALAGITANRVARALPTVGFLPPKPLIPQPPPKRSEAGFFPPPTFPSSLPVETASEQATSAVPKANRREVLGRFVDDFAADDGRSAEDLAAALSAALSRPADTADSTRAPRRDHRAWWDDYELLDETVDRLVSLLPSPQPSSTGWPTGWQGHGTFDADVQRLADLADGLYRQGKHVPSDLVEAALEGIGVRLRLERPVATDLPPARTGWRDLPMPFEEGGIAAVIASCLSTLMSSAFDAGFDRRALRTGLRILASATASAKRGERDQAMAYTNALIRFTLDTSLHGREAASQAGGHRVQVVLVGVISECDQLLEVARQQKDHVRDVYEAAEDLALALAWNTPHGQMFDTVIAMLQIRLAAAGWPVDLPSGQRRVHELDELVTQPPARPLSGEVLRETEELFTHWIGHGEGRLPAAALITLWAHAACAMRDGSPEEAARIATFLTEQLRDYDNKYAEMPAPLAAPGEEQRPGYQPLDPQLRRLILTAARWCIRANPDITPTIPHAAGPRTVHAVARWLVAQPETAEWTYRGGDDVAGTHLVTVEMPDHSRRVLRDRNVRTGDLTWGYGGSGPHALSAVLLADILADQRWCRDCLGVTPLAAEMITCSSCSNSGMLHGTRAAEGDLVTTVIAQLPEEFERTRLQLLRSILGVQPPQSETPLDAAYLM